MPTLTPIAVHVLCWTVYVLLYALLWSDPGSNLPGNIAKHLFLLPAKLILVYTCIFFLVPRYLNRGRFFVFIMLLVLLIIGCVALHMLYLSFILRPEISLFDETGKSLDWKYITKQATFLNSPLFFALGIVMTRHWHEEKANNTKIKEARLQMEFQVLKNQLQPHFFFNTLNNLYSLAVRKSDETPIAILKLAGMMRYLTYQQSSERVKLEEELEYLFNYASLEELRYGNAIRIRYDLDKNMPKGVTIPPLLLAPLLENAFKHGADPVLTCRIALSLEVKDDYLLYSISNTKRQKQNDEVQNTGVGIVNLRKRLEILYKTDFILETIDQDNFRANLKIPVSYASI
jgi:two-component system LytT family sensor kinase